MGMRTDERMAKGSFLRYYHHDVDKSRWYPLWRFLSTASWM